MFDFALLIPILALSIPILVIWTRHQRSMAEIQLKVTAEKAAQYATSNAELEERLRVLERIITDGGFDTALQIEALRDARQVEAQRASERAAARDAAVN
ncbi:hypothetical protein [Novosphingobium album (ex Liu et al. 2023)]|uniref:Envelope stress response membrane protein PspB n=1 Tax=Novosphingobium album (ex Liu et al. 2023) TaxID=3031130 RepID=A0ABT5WSP8_9SPHN|nr:hypothetical protein [Novosphingobium album (ex Liu et al. 2023)]MDE8653076.1 hypothetical protein [Novosphingobium album (ex Liu et al. 2023)]